MIPEIIGTILSAMIAAGLFKKRLYCIWIRNVSGTTWINTNPKGNTKRQCRKAVAVMEESGIFGAAIYPLGLTPPEIKVRRVGRGELKKTVSGRSKKAKIDN